VQSNINKDTMQLQLPIFPSTTKLLSDTWGVFEKDDFVFYLHNGSPVHVHKKEDLNTYRYITGNLIVTSGIKPSGLSRVFGVGVRNFERYAKQYRDGGADAFFKPSDQRGKCHKMTPEKLVEAQKHLDNNLSQAQTANLIHVNEASIRYHLKKGTLKKKS